jgi:hypothetical protein
MLLTEAFSFLLLLLLLLLLLGCVSVIPADLRAVATRLHTYISNRSYQQEPEGRTLKKVDESQIYA